MKGGGYYKPAGCLEQDQSCARRNVQAIDSLIRGKPGALLRFRFQKCKSGGVPQKFISISDVSRRRQRQRHRSFALPSEPIA
jgi:hypothetical protein